MEYDYKIDETIVIKILNDKKRIRQYGGKEEELHFNGISMAVEDLYRPITPRILNLHLVSVPTIYERYPFCAKTWKGRLQDDWP